MALVLPALRGRVVGALACQRDSYLRSLDTEVISCVKFSPPKPSQNGTKKQKPTTDASKTSAPLDLWLVEFADSVLFPEGASQHSATTWLIWADKTFRRRPTVRPWYHPTLVPSIIGVYPDYICSTSRTALCPSFPKALISW